MKRPLRKTNPSSVQKGIPSEEKMERQALQSLVYPHIQSFNNFIEYDLPNSIEHIFPVEIDLKPPMEKDKAHLENKEADSADIDDLPDTSLPLIRLKVWFENVTVGKPSRVEAAARDGRLFPAECRERGISYNGILNAKVAFSISQIADDSFVASESSNFTRTMGNVPIMVGSSLCHLKGLSPAELVHRKEDAMELGGYFICNGNERVMRLLQLQKANYISAVERPSFKKRGAEFTEKAVSIRCVTPRCFTITNTLHYLRDGTMVFKFFLKKQEFFVPVMLLLKALKYPMSSDREIYNAIIGNQIGDVEFSSRIELSLSQIGVLKLFSALDCRKYLGQKFRTMLPEISESWSDEVVGEHLIQRFILVHCMNDEQGSDKFNVLVEMIRKLLRFVLNRCIQDNPDALSGHDLLLPGQIYGQILRERLEQTLLSVRSFIRRDLALKIRSGALNLGTYQTFFSKKYIRTVFEKQPDIGQKLSYFLTTGNLSSESGLDMMQVAGYTVVAEKLNHWRYLSHFRSVHRGQFFTEMRTTTVRKLLPESWGFLCPVHTPDGGPCGLLTHLAAQATVSCGSRGQVEAFRKRSDIKKFLISLGMVSMRPPIQRLNRKNGANNENVEFQPVFLDGIVLGYATNLILRNSIVPMIRSLKVQTINTSIQPSTRMPYIDTTQLLENDHPNELSLSGSVELLFVDDLEFGTNRTTCYPGLFLFSGPGRVVRPVVNLEHGKLELIGPAEQLYMNIAVNVKEAQREHSHCEVFDASMLSLVASLTPFSDFNQSPRNMYQCQMSKQTMGTPGHNLKFRNDSKMYKINNPQAPLCQNANQSNFLMDEFPNGTNAVVAVISYTGFDMEDACIINRASINRGFKHGTVFKTCVVDLVDKPNHFIGNISLKSFEGASKEADKPILERVKAIRSLDFDGLPYIGQKIGYMEPYCAIYDCVEGRVSPELHKSTEVAFVESVKILSTGDRKPKSYSAYESDKITPTSLLKFVSGVKKAIIKLRYVRNPIVGDKFASRAGQKGVMSIAWPQEDFPFTDSGITPDIIINPHAFPSRMTIGMLLESMAGKSGSLHGMFQDSTPFRMQGDGDGENKKTAVDYFGEQLLKSGFSYYGAESMYSGLLGTPLQVDIYIGLVYYQRLRHMVSDKSQVRSTGPIDPTTRQPVKGRKRMGGVRFGEMERDSLLAHGVAFLAQDRLLNCSDRHIAYICCGSMLSVVRDKTSSERVCLRCKVCSSSENWKAIAVPFVLRYLVNELAAMGIKWDFNL